MAAAVGKLVRPLGAAVAVALVLVVAVLGYQAVSSSATKHLTAYFPRTIGIYQGSAVKVLGVDVGQVTRVEPQGTRVRVDMTYPASQKLPVDVGAALVPPSIVSDRYVQLLPAYTGGPVLGDNAVLQEDHTEVPVELDAIFGSLNDLNTALGPQGANKNGALSRLINVGAANLAGNGSQFNATLHGFSQAISALSDSRDALFGTVSELQKFTTNIAVNDAGVRRVNADLASVAGQLAGERHDLGAALANLATALGQINTFVADNRGLIKHDVASLKTITQGLVGEQQAIKEIIDLAPLGLHNLAGAFDAQADGGKGVLRTRTNVDPNALACAIVTGITGTQSCSSSGSGSGSTAGGSLGGTLGSLGNLLVGAAR